MKILIISQYFWPENFRINDLARGLSEQGDQVTVLTGIPNYPDGRFFDGYGIFRLKAEYYHGIKVVRVPVVPRGKGGIARLMLNYLSFTLFACILAPFICRGKFDIIFFNLSPMAEGIPAMIFKRLKRAKLIFWVQDLWPETLSAIGAVKSRILLSLIGELIRIIYHDCDRILVASEGFVPYVESVMGGKSEKISYFPSWAENLYRPVVANDDILKNIHLPTGFRVMFAGNIGVSQDFDTILSAAERLRNYSDIHWIILGEGRMRSWVEAQIEKRILNRTVHLLGRHPVDKMPYYFALADVMLVTLKRDPIFASTIPGKVQSYLACGRPVVAALDGEGKRLVEESGIGRVAPTGNADALSRAVMEMYNMPKSQREGMGLRGREYYISNFERNILISILDGLMKESIDKGALRQC
jgi:colanic acid biosynthesis glycosyl transferase WcaI